jgi:hypothetical protein
MQCTSTGPRAKGPRDKPRTQDPIVQKLRGGNRGRNHEEADIAAPVVVRTVLVHAESALVVVETEVEIVQLLANIEQDSQRMILLDVRILEGKLKRGERVGEHVAVLEAVGDSALLQGLGQITVVHDLAEMDFADLFDRLARTAERNVAGFGVDVLVAEVVRVDGGLDRILRTVVDRNAVAADEGLKAPFRQLHDRVADIRTHRLDEFVYLRGRDSGEHNGLQKSALGHVNEFRSLAAGHARSRF